MKPAHLRAQSAMVRMLYDPTFAAAVREQPRVVLSSLPMALADQMGALDPRALRRDEHRRERTLGQLCEELPASVALALDECGRMSLLLDFYGSAQFHDAIEEGRPLVLALGEYLESCLADAKLQSPALAAVLALELASARARRDVRVATPGPLLRCAHGVEPIETAAGALAVLQTVLRHRFRLSLMTSWALATDPPKLTLLPLGAERETFCAVALDGEVSLVQIERPLHAVLVSARTARSRTAILDEATMRLHGDRTAAEAALDALMADELLIFTS